MIQKSVVEELLQTLPDDYFVVDLAVSGSNKIELVIDRMNGVNIDDIVTVSRLIEGNFDREKEDFELNVYSPGLGSPFKVPKQYVKNVGREIEINRENEKPIKGKLLAFNEDTQEITLEVEEKVKLPDSKKKTLVKKETSININEIKTAKNIISFK